MGIKEGREGEGRRNEDKKGEEKGKGRGGKISPPRSFLKVGAYGVNSHRL